MLAAGSIAVALISRAFNRIGLRIGLRIGQGIISRFGSITDPTDLMTHQLLRYALVGGVAYLADFGALVVLTELLGVHYLVSAALGFLIGLVTNYTLSTAWVFRTRRFNRKFTEFSIFAVIGFGGLGLNELLIWVFTGLAHVHYLHAKIISTGFVLLWNFSVRKYFLFS